MTNSVSAGTPDEVKTLIESGVPFTILWTCQFIAVERKVITDRHTQNTHTHIHKFGYFLFE